MRHEASKDARYGFPIGCFAGERKCSNDSFRQIRMTTERIHLGRRAAMGLASSWGV